MKKILVTGANGQLAKNLKSLVESKPIENQQFLFLIKNNSILPIKKWSKPFSSLTP